MDQTPGTASATATTLASNEVQPHVGGFCEGCGHFAGRHDEQGCHFDRPDPAADCACPVMTWEGREWPRPWLPFPDGMTRATVPASASSS